jgi:putative membrane protein
MQNIEAINERKWLAGIAILSVVIVAAVAFLIYQAQGVTSFNPRIYTLPKLNAFLNGSVFILLLAGFYFIRNGNIRAHRACMLTAFIFSAVFLISYVTYHYSAPESRFGDLDHNGIVTEMEKAAAGSVRYLYFFLLITHIILATVIVPLALVTLFRIFNLQVEKHKKLARITLPVWLYVSLTGVIVYLMISPYYPV